MRCAISLITDILATVFTVTGVQTVASAFNTIAAAQEKLAKAQSKAAADPASDKLKKGLKDAEEAAEKAGNAVLGSFIRPAIAGMALLVSAMRDVNEEYTKFAVASMNLRDITGASGKDSIKAETTFRGFGINDSQVMRDMLRLSKDTISPEGKQSLGKLGIDPNSGATGLALLNQVADKLDKITAGTAKAALETKLFGLRGVTALQPYLRAGEAARRQMADLSTMTEANLAVVQQWEMANAMLGATFEQKIVFPIMGLVMPALVGLVQGITTVVGWMGKVNEVTGGWAGLAVVIGLMAAGAVMFGAALAIIVPLLLATTAGLILQNAALAVRDALLGPPGWVALAVAGITIAGIAAFNAWNSGHPDAGGKDANTKALTENTAALDKQNDNLSKMNRGGIPEGLNRFDVQQLSHQRALCAIG